MHDCCEDVGSCSHVVANTYCQSRKLCSGVDLDEVTGMLSDGMSTAKMESDLVDSRAKKI